MFYDGDVKDLSSSNAILSDGLRYCDDREVCLNDSSDRAPDDREPDDRRPDDRQPAVDASSSRIDLDGSRPSFPDVFFPESPLQQPNASFAWTEDDTIASFMARAAFGAERPRAFSEGLDVFLNDDIKEKVSSDFTCKAQNPVVTKRVLDSEPVSSTSSGFEPLRADQAGSRTQHHCIKIVKRGERTIRMFECRICGHTFQHQYTLMRHMPTHTDERKYVCDECGKSFRQLSTLSQHRPIHSSKRPYICEMCKKTFNRLSTLISHRKIHSDDKPFKCHFCFRGFHQKGNLRHHMFTHTNERPYRCSVCFRGFNQQSNLVCHKNKAHPSDMNVKVHKRYKSFGDLLPAVELKSETERLPSDEFEVSSTVGPGPSYDRPSTSGWTPKTISQEQSKLYPAPDSSGGDFVDPTNTYHMEFTNSNEQISLSLLKEDENYTVLVKVVDANFLGGQPMLLPATAADIRDGRLLYVLTENRSEIKASESIQQLSGAVHSCAPVLGTIVPQVSPIRFLQLVVGETPFQYNSSVTTDISCPEFAIPVPVPAPVCPPPAQTPNPMTVAQHYDDRCTFQYDATSPGFQSLPTLTSPPPSLDDISLDWFEPLENMSIDNECESSDTTADSGEQTDKLEDFEKVPFWVLQKPKRGPQTTAVETPTNPPAPEPGYKYVNITVV